MGFEFKIDENLCIGCGNCVVVCPVDALNSPEVSGGKGANIEDLTRLVSNGKAVVVDAAICNGCGTCVISCPTDALSLSGSRPMDSITVIQAEENDLVGLKADIFDILKRNDNLTISQISQELGLGTREVFLHLMALKRENRVFEGEKVGGRFAYTLTPPKIKEKVETLKEEFIVDHERAEKVRKKLEEAISSFTKTKVRMMIETNKLDRAYEAVTNKPKGGEVSK